MPQVKSVPTLFQTCLDYITDHMDEWAKKSPKLNGTEDIELIEKTTNPFHDIPSIIMDEIITCLKKKKLLETKIIELLITPQLRTLDFSSMCEDNEVSGLLRLVTIKSPDLKNLWLSHSTYFLDNDDYVSFIPKLSNLELLDISYSKKGDSCLHLLGKHCKDLRVLYAKWSTVSDDGIQGLCVTGQCKSIHTLNVFQSSVTTSGLQLAIQNLPALTILGHELVVGVLADVAKAAAEKELEIPQLSLSTLHTCLNSKFCTPLHYGVGSLALALSLCSSITTLDLKIPEELTDHELQALPPLNNLSVLRFVSGNHITFDGGVVPLLKSFGKSLKSLELCFLDVVNIRAIIEYCPNLNTLTLLCNNSFSMAWQEEERKPCEEKRIKMEFPELKNLEELNIVHFGICVEKETILALLSFSSLKSIHLRGCCLLTDDILLKAANCHSFKNLETLEIFECKSVSKKGIDVLMKGGNSLKKLEIRDCGRILPKHIASWTRKAARKYWDLSIYPDVSVPLDFGESDSESIDDSESDDEEPARRFFNYMVNELLQAVEIFFGDESSDEEGSDEDFEYYDESGDEEEDLDDD